MGFPRGQIWACLCGLIVMERRICSRGQTQLSTDGEHISSSLLFKGNELQSASSDSVIHSLQFGESIRTLGTLGTRPHRLFPHLSLRIFGYIIWIINNLD